MVVIALWAQTFNGWLIGLAVVIGVMAIGGLVMSMMTARKSQIGAETAAKWKAFGRYLTQMEKEMEPSERLALIDAFLPWAIALGFNKSQWKQTMEDDRDYRWGSHQYRPWDDDWESRPATSGSSGGFNLQGMSNRSMAGLQTANFSMFAMLNSASDTFSAGSSSSGSGSGSAGVGSSGGGGHSFS